jgi:hypothetical protein
MPVYHWTEAGVPLVVRVPQFDKPWPRGWAIDPLVAASSETWSHPTDMNNMDLYILFNLYIPEQQARRQKTGPYANKAYALYLFLHVILIR